MKKPTTRSCCLAGLAVMMLLAAVVAVAATMPEPPRVSTFASTEDLIGQLREYVSELEESVESKNDYLDAKEKLAKDADTVLLIALALGLHDEDNKFKQAAPGLVKTAAKVAKATDFEAAKAAVQAVKEAGGSKGDPSQLSWQDAHATSLPALMKQVPLINTKMKRWLRGSYFKSRADRTTGMSAVLATIAQGSMVLADKTDKPGEAEKWHVFCAQMRDSAARLNAAIRSQDQETARQELKHLTQSCDDCHAIFHPEAEKETGTDE
jgi:hypothetical protein